VDDTEETEQEEENDSRHVFGMRLIASLAGMERVIVLLVFILPLAEMPIYFGLAFTSLFPGSITWHPRIARQQMSHFSGYIRSVKPLLTFVFNSYLQGHSK
jgi:hypothetical protein